MCAVHANYLSGNHKKMNRMKDYGFWLATQDEQGHYQERCAEYTQFVPAVPTPLLTHGKK